MVFSILEFEVRIELCSYSACQSLPTLKKKRLITNGLIITLAASRSPDKIKVTGTITLAVFHVHMNIGCPHLPQFPTGDTRVSW